MKKPLFKGNGKPSHLSTGRRSRKGSGLWLINVAVMLGVGVVIFFIIFFLTNFGMLSTELHEMDDEHFVQTVQEDYYPPERLAQTLAQPRHSPYIVMRVTKRLSNASIHHNSPKCSTRWQEQVMMMCSSLLLRCAGSETCVGLSASLCLQRN
ncbi:MAG: hypothetical protein U5N86_01915 [Planctomycetota bacterium]|nr:hypothetical protein [Planctomycetota bacterium]